jgi:photosystem II stability/assembly factor-like uncharacterized protein
MKSQKGAATPVLLLCALSIVIATWFAINQKSDSGRADRSFSLSDLGSFDGWAYPIEFNPPKRYNYIGAGLRSISSAPDESAIWVVGDTGTVLVSIDRGATWLPKAINWGGPILAVIAISADFAIVRTEEEIWVTRDRGMHWARTKDPAGAKVISDWYYDSETKRLWVLTRDRTVRSVQISSDELTWTTEPGLPSPKGDKDECKPHLIAVHPVRHSKLLLCGREAFYARAGEGWTSVELPPVSESEDTPFQSIAIGPDGNTLWLGGLGATWSKPVSSGDWGSWQALPPKGEVRIWARDFVVVPSSGSLFVVDMAGRVFKRVESRHAWMPVAVDVVDAVQLAATSRSLLLVTSGGGIWDASLTGDSFARRAVGEAGSFRRIIHHPLVPGEFLILSSTGSIFQTHGGGHSLSEYGHMLKEEVALDMAARTPEEIWRVGETGLSTPMPSQRRQYVPSGDHLWTIRFAADGRIGFVAGEGDGAIHGTTNGGKTWDEIATLNETAIYELFIDEGAKHMWLATSTGPVMLSQSADGGWVSVRNAPKTNLHSVVVVGKQGWACGDNGVILSSTDGGARWQSQDSTSTTMLYRIRFHKDGQHGIAVGNNGVILVTANAGQLWKHAKSDTTVNLRDVIFSDDTTRVWAVGWGNTFMLSENLGQTWKRIEGINDANYRWLPAPWYIALLGLCVWYAWVRARAATIGRSTAIPAIAVSDNPITDAADDRFGFAELAQAVSQFIRNVNTRPPFIVALTGQWGSGKSSVMHLLRQDLIGAGFRPIWWNAWHYQDEVAALASVMEHIRSQAVPSFFSIDNFRLRWRLLYLRLLRPVMMPMLALTAFGVAILWMSLIEKHAGLLRALGSIEALKDGPTKVTYLLGILLGSGAIWVVRLMKPFSRGGKVLSALWSQVWDSARIRSLPFDAGVRYKFAKEFGDLTEALSPAKLVLIVDDLDRCHPDRIVNVLETVNFLVTSGNCIVVLGMDLEKVLASVSVAFEKVARASSAVPAGNDAVKQAGAETIEYAYAYSYIRKLINLEVCVPTQGLEIHRMMFGVGQGKRAPPSSAHRGRFEIRVALGRLAAAVRAVRCPSLQPLGWRRSELHEPEDAPPEFWKTAGSADEFVTALAKFVRIAVLGALGWVGGQQLVLYADEKFPAQQEEPDERPQNIVRPTAAEAKVAAKPTKSVAPLAELPIDPTRRYSPVAFIPGSKLSPSRIASPLGLAAVLAIFGIWRTYFAGPVHDSRTFEAAMHHWSRQLSNSLVTPREMKRFLNRIRFAALRVRIEQRQRPIRILLTKLKALVRAIWDFGVNQAPPRGPTGTTLAIDEETLVRLAAYQTCGGDMRALLAECSTDMAGNTGELCGAAAELRALDSRLADLLFVHRDIVQRTAALAAYEAILGGVRY